YLGAPELCDGVDNDCDLTVPANESDADADLYRICEGDCDDNAVYANPAGFDDPVTVDFQEDCVLTGTQSYTNINGQSLTVCDGEPSLIGDGDYNGSPPAEVTLFDISGPIAYDSEGYDPGSGVWQAGEQSLFSPGPGFVRSANSNCRQIALVGLVPGEEYATSLIIENNMSVYFMNVTFYLDGVGAPDVFATLDASPSTMTHEIAAFTATGSTHTVYLCTGGSYTSSSPGQVREDKLAVVRVNYVCP
ncbi:hypothetical protein HQ524_03940, partial [Candidatus Uhrbacteria bacterium]|nr:hypothetical protein [Candidatus Uhrbacteria bacterium]